VNYKGKVANHRFIDRKKRNYEIELRNKRETRLSQMNSSGKMVENQWNQT
jgi:competence protein ComGC